MTPEEYALQVCGGAPGDSDERKLVELAFLAGYRAAMEEVMQFANDFCDEQTELTDGEGNARFDEEDFQGESCSASELRDALKAICEGEG